MKTRLVFLLSLFGLAMNAQTISGNLMRWHKITLAFEGPTSSETSAPNPFTDYRLDVTFSNGSKSYVVPGYYAACDDPANTSCTSGNVWKVHFSPDRTGTWSWSASFTTGTDVAVDGGGLSAGFFNGDSGTFTVSESNKSGKDFRTASLGRLQYVGEHYLQHSGTTPDNPNGPWFIKAGPDSPENAFNYEDFDGALDYLNPINLVGSKSWSAHQQDYVASDASEYVWSGGRGTELLGVINYISSEGANSMSFLSWNTGGDDGAVFPHLFTGDIADYGVDELHRSVEQWNMMEKDRFDVSKLAQWEKIMEYADKKGVYLHFKTMETENDNFMDNNTLGRERKLYYRELIARFSHHLALNWNITEESTLNDDLMIDVIDYVNATDPYDHNIVFHTYPNQKNLRYTPMLGNNSLLTGTSLQSTIGVIHTDVLTWIQNSSNAGKKWVVANDEQGPAGRGVREDALTVRRDVLYATLMAGGAGVEYYYGYTTTDGDINNENHRLRGDAYKHCGYAIDFFNTYLQDNLIEMSSNDALTSSTDDYVFANEGEIYVVYRPAGGSTAISLPSGNFTVQWYNPREGGSLSAEENIIDTLTAPDANDWLALIKTTDDVVVEEECDNPSAFLTIQAEDYCNESGIDTDTANTKVGWINNGDWIMFEGVDFETGASSISISASSGNSGGNIEVRQGSSSGTLLGSVSITNTGGWTSFETFSSDISAISGSQDIYLVFTGNGTGHLLDVDYFEFTESITSDTFVPDPTKVYYIDSPFHNVRLAADGESEEPYTTSTTTTGADVEWQFVARGNGSWHIQRAAGGTNPRLRTDNTLIADMQPTTSRGIYTYYDFSEGVIENTYFLTLPDGPSDYQRLQVDRQGTVVFKPTGHAGTWESFLITEVENTTIANFERIEAEDYDTMNGVDTQGTTDAGGGQNVGWIHNGDWLMFEDVNLTGAQSADMRIACNFTGGTVEVRIGSSTGTLIGEVDVVNTGGNQNWVTLSTNLSNVTGVHDLYLVFTGGAGYLYNINWLEFSSSQASAKSIGAININDVTIFPNPVEEITTISGAANSIIKLFDITGKLLFSKNVTNDNEQVNLSSLPVGIYYAQVQGLKTIAILKVIKTKN